MATLKPRRVPCEIYSRVVGYYRPVKNWNDGKRQEWKDRKKYDKAVKNASSKIK